MKVEDERQDADVWSDNNPPATDSRGRNVGDGGVACPDIILRVRVRWALKHPSRRHRQGYGCTVYSSQQPILCVV